MSESQAKQFRLNVAAWEPRSVVNGPGERFVLWLQGCPFRCRGCFNQEFLPNVERNSLRVAELVDLITGVQNLEGVTFSGGEPMAQAEGLFYLSKALRDRGLTVVCYSGYTMAELTKSRDPWVAQSLSTIDILVDGRFEEGLRINAPLRGSENQQIHFLSETYAHLSPGLHERGREIEFVIGKGGFVTTGIVDEELVSRLEALLNTGKSR